LIHLNSKAEYLFQSARLNIAPRRSQMTAPEKDARRFEMDDSHWASLCKVGQRHKYDYGHAVILSGPLGQGGAARLAARGALRIGAGLVSIMCQRNAVAEHAVQLNAIMVKPYQDADEVPNLLQSLKAKAICIGPNLGLDETAKHLLALCLSVEQPICIDADAITLMSRTARDCPPILNPQSVLTPHEGELRRFIPECFERTDNRQSLARFAAQKAGCVVLFKGPDTVIAAPDGRAVVVSSDGRTHTGWLATAGSGDVLSGFVTGLLARGFEGFDAAALAADLHYRCAEHFGPGLIAEDLSEMLPLVMRQRI
jgi:hydroxyethylthiazole kinase-like uncharacterized protein yjeF